MIKLDLDQCSKRVLKVYAEDATNVENIRQLLTEKEEVVYVELAGNSHADKETLSYLYERYARPDTTTFCRRVFEALLINPAVTEDILIEMAKAVDSKELAEAFIDNPSIPGEAIDILFRKYGKSYWLSQKMINHKNTWAKTLIKITQKHVNLANPALRTGKVKLVEI